MIQFFVSSTFRDMHYERDIINSVIFITTAQTYR